VRTASLAGARHVAPGPRLAREDRRSANAAVWLESVVSVGEGTGFSLSHNGMMGTVTDEVIAGDDFLEKSARARDTDEGRGGGFEAALGATSAALEDQKENSLRGDGGALTSSSPPFLF